MELAIDKEAREDNKIVAAWLVYYAERRRDYYNSREEIIHSTSRPDGLPGGYSISDTTGRKGQKLGDLQDVGRWLELVEEVERRLPWKLQILLRLKRIHRRGVRGRPVRWIIALELSEEVSRKIRKDYSVGPDTIDEWWNKVVEYGARIAGKRGLL